MSRPRGEWRCVQWTLVVSKSFADDVDALHARVAAGQAVPPSRSEFIVGLLRRGVRAVVEEAERAQATEREQAAETPTDATQSTGGV